MLANETLAPLAWRRTWDYALGLSQSPSWGHRPYACSLSLGLVLQDFAVYGGGRPQSVVSGSPCGPCLTYFQASCRYTQCVWVLCALEGDPEAELLLLRVFGGCPGPVLFSFPFTGQPFSSTKHIVQRLRMGIPFFFLPAISVSLG